MLEQDLAQFTGTENYYKYIFGLKLTDGVKYLAEKGKCFWIMDIIASYQSKLSKNPFQLWELIVASDKSAIITCREDTETKILVKQKIPWTDFEMTNIKIYVIDGVVLLPSEY
jgi:hypothetical protein